VSDISSDLSVKFFYLDFKVRPKVNKRHCYSKA